MIGLHWMQSRKNVYLRIIIAQIPSNATEDQLREIFEPCGNIVDLALLKKNPGAGQ
jgi:RNA recognition motif-containing protein